MKVNGQTAQLKYAYLSTEKYDSGRKKGLVVTLTDVPLDAAQVRWRCVNAPHLVALVRAETTFVHGFIIEREEQEYAA